jgi:hypothetical protein
MRRSPRPRSAVRSRRKPPTRGRRLGTARERGLRPVCPAAYCIRPAIGRAVGHDRSSGDPAPPLSSSRSRSPGMQRCSRGRARGISARSLARSLRSSAFKGAASRLASLGPVGPPLTTAPTAAGRVPDQASALRRSPLPLLSRAGAIAVGPAWRSMQKRAARPTGTRGRGARAGPSVAETLARIDPRAWGPPTAELSRLIERFVARGASAMAGR